MAVIQVVPRSDDRKSTYVLDRYAAMDERMSVSLRDVSSNPGVSIKVTMRPLRRNGLDVRTSDVQLSRPRPTGKLDPLARLMNCWNPMVSDESRLALETAYGRFTTSSGSHHPVNVMLGNGEPGCGPNTYAILISFPRRAMTISAGQ